MDEYFDLRMRGDCLLHHTAEWERPAPPVLTPANFYTYVPWCPHPSPQLHGLTEASRDLGYRLVEFALWFLEGLAEDLATRLGVDPTPVEIVAEAQNCCVQYQHDPAHPVFMFSRAMTNRVVEAAVINAVHSRWGFPRNPHAAVRTIPETQQAPPPYASDHAYSFAPPGYVGRQDLYAYLRQHAEDYPALLGRADWELDLNDLPDRITTSNFPQAVPMHSPSRANIRQASLALCHRLVWFALHHLEQTADYLIKRRQVEPTPAEIMAQLHREAKQCGPRQGDALKMYARVTVHPVMATALANAMHYRWGFPRNQRAPVPAGAVPVSARLPVNSFIRPRQRPMHCPTNHAGTQSSRSLASYSA